MKKNLVRILCVVMVLMIGILPLASARSYKYVKTANGKTVNVRSNPWKDGTRNVICRLNYGAMVLVYEYNSNKTWAYIEADNPDGSSTTVKGWVQASFLVSSNPGKYVPTDPTLTTTVADLNKVAKAIKVLSASYTTEITTKKAASYVHLRVFPDTNAVYTGQYLRGTQIEVLAESNTWAQVRIVADGKVGFILKSCVAAQ